MDRELERLMRRNEKKRQILDGYNIDPEEFTIFELMEEKLPPIDVCPISSSREREEPHGWI